MGFGFSFSALLVGDEWRARRKAFHPFFTPAAVTNYHPLQTKHMHVLLNELLKSPGDFMDLLRRCVRHLLRLLRVSEELTIPG